MTKLYLFRVLPLFCIAILISFSSGMAQKSAIKAGRGSSGKSEIRNRPTETYSAPDPEPVYEPEPEPAWEPEPEPVYEPEPEPAYEPDPEPVYEPEPAYEPDPEPVYEPEPAYEPDPEPVYEPEPEPVYEPKPVSKPDYQWDSDPVDEPTTEPTTTYGTVEEAPEDSDTQDAPSPANEDNQGDVAPAAEPTVESVRPPSWTSPGLNPQNADPKGSTNNPPVIMVEGELQATANFPLVDTTREDTVIPPPPPPPLPVVTPESPLASILACIQQVENRLRRNFNDGCSAGELARFENNLSSFARYIACLPASFDASEYKQSYAWYAESYLFRYDECGTESYTDLDWLEDFLYRKAAYIPDLVKEFDPKQVDIQTYIDTWYIAPDGGLDYYLLMLEFNPMGVRDTLQIIDRQYQELQQSPPYDQLARLPNTYEKSEFGAGMLGKVKKDHLRATQIVDFDPEGALVLYENAYFLASALSLFDRVNKSYANWQKKCIEKLKKHSEEWRKMFEERDSLK